MQMQEKTMVADTLAGINGELVHYAEMIPQTDNKELKTTLKQMSSMWLTLKNFSNTHHI